MGTYINIGNAGFQRIRRSEYIDKSGLIAVVNSTLFTEWNMSCVSRCRRFGKSMAAKMLCAYYDRSCDSRSLFQDLAVANDPSFETHLNRYPVIYLDLTTFVTRFHDEHIVKQIDRELLADIHEEYPDIPTRQGDDLMAYLIRIVQITHEPFVFIIDEWDAVCRELSAAKSVVDIYVNWLRRMFKDANASRVFAGVYMTGILPIKKYNTQSALNNFIEYSMVEPVNMAPYFGFTKAEVTALTQRSGMDYDELEKWYDGYQIGDELSIFNPNSVMMAIRSRRCRSYWAATGAYDAVAAYIQMNYEGLKDDIIAMLSGKRVKVNPTKFQNDMSVVRGRDDVLTVLIHLGYLSYDGNRRECYIPNYEVSCELVNAVEETNWTRVAEALRMSEQLLADTLAGKAEAVAHGVERVHDEHTSILSYNDENSLSCVLSIAYYFAHNDYVFHRELATGKGFADLVLIPRKNVDTPAIVLELKCDQSADAAIDQIMRREYTDKVREYAGRLLLVGISYDRKAKKHSCNITPYVVNR